MSSRRAVEFLLGQLDETWARVQGYLAGLTADEFVWSPGGPVWHLAPSERDGRWTIPYTWIPPEPVPFTTIAWRMAHIATSKVLVLDHAFGARQARLSDLDVPTEVDGMMTYMRQCHVPLREQVERLTDDDLDSVRLTEWGEPRSTERILGSAILHDLEHAAQIGTVRELYRRWENDRGPQIR
jgi:hypothetical protein